MIRKGKGLWDWGTVFNSGHRGRSSNINQLLWLYDIHHIGLMKLKIICLPPQHCEFRMRGHYHCLRPGCYFVTNITTKLPWHVKKHEKAERRAANGFKYFTKREECGRLGKLSERTDLIPHELSPDVSLPAASCSLHYPHSPSNVRLNFWYCARRDVWIKLKKM